MTDTSTTRSSAGFVGQWSGRLVRALEFGTTGRPAGGDWTLWHKACAGHAPSATELVRTLTPQAHGLAMQMLVGLALAVFAGLKLDEWLHFKTPLLVWILPLLVIVAMIYQVIKDTSKK